MEKKTLYFSQIDPSKLSIVFTWDDNFERHATSIGPIFKHFNKRCTFYINPGEPNFQSRLLGHYLRLSLNGFEIGSHGHTHHHYSKLSHRDFVDQLLESKASIQTCLHIDPITFAFPHHDYNAIMLKEAKQIYFETRNTLNNSFRFGLKRDTNLNEIKDVIYDTLSSNKSLIFSGHSIQLQNDNGFLDGYEPVHIRILVRAIKESNMYSENAEICTFQQAAIKEYIKSNCLYNQKKFELLPAHIRELGQYGIKLKYLKKLV